MASVFNIAAGVGQTADMAWELKCREEDMAQRALENERRAIDDARRAVDEKAQQLKAIASNSALIAGFSMVVMVEIAIPDDLHPALLVVFGCTTAGVVSLMLIAMLNATFMLVAILRYDCVVRDVAFHDFWRKRCDSDWRLALRCFAYGVPLFMAVLAQIGWVIFWTHDTARNYASTLVTLIAFCTIVLWFAHTERKWSEFLLSADAKLRNPHAGVVVVQQQQRHHAPSSSSMTKTSKHSAQIQHPSSTIRSTMSSNAFVPPLNGTTPTPPTTTPAIRETTFLNGVDVTTEE
eukprot:CAMPEP_0195284074 /NCGR_PEP_ID=MMETSP0707-20130614/2412_1 /TAXON_ID=33640 /ORGANISM="Asterionellopsis glacialis, Strain CCMP134" /LENGTH=291 /DNA_ID=CAMNT_0040343369 /DNA_START=142 /DNA_END=1017 /DNA_ORIENTATION=-